MNTIFLFSLLFLLLSSCSRNGSNSRIKPLSQDNPIIRATPQEKTTDFKKETYHITIKPEALKQRFLLTFNMSSPQYAFERNFAAKVVFFRKQGRQLFMFEDTEGKLYTDTMQTKIILGRFDIVKETSDGEITFNFQDGITILLGKRNFGLGSSADARPYFEGKAINITHSYVEKVTLMGKYILIDHAVRGETLVEGGVQTSISGRVTYSLSTYLSNENFKPTLASDQDKAGFFFVPPLAAPGEGIYAPIMKPDISKETIFYLDPNIPEKFHQAVADGLLYWNGVYGKEIIRVEPLPEGVHPDNPGVNVVAWLDWDNNPAAPAYANVTADPLTGEVLFCRLYLTSFLGKVGTHQAFQTYRFHRIEASREASFQNVRGQGHSSCRLHGSGLQEDASAQLQEIMGQVPNLTREQGQKISERYSSDVIRWTAAHEMGHCLGLRHNFAASTTTTLTKENYQNIFRDYVYSGTLPEEIVLASSYMDYYPPQVGAMLGAHIRLKRSPLAYDVQAVQYTLGRTSLLAIKEPFCSEEHLRTGRFGDCRQFDSFENSFVWFEYRMDWLDKLFSLNLLSKYSSFFNPRKRRRSVNYFSVIKNLPLTPREDVQQFFSPLLEAFIKTLVFDAEFIGIKKNFYAITGMNEHEYRETTQNFISKNVQNLGGVSQLLFKDLTPVESDDGLILAKTNRMMANFSHYLANSGLMITPHEALYLKDRAKKYFKVLEREMLLKTVQLLKSSEAIVPQDEEFASNLAVFVKGVLFSKSSKALGDSTLYRPLFEYRNGEDDLRKETLSLLAHDFYPHSPSYMKEINKLSLDILQTHRQEVDDLLSSRVLEELPNTLYDWVSFEQERFFPLSSLVESLKEEEGDEVVSKVDADSGNEQLRPDSRPYPY